jgi:hypothetical protein
MEELFDLPLMRFGTSGTLILFYGLVDGWARRAGSIRPARLPGAAWMRGTLLVSILLFYLLIGPAGSAMWHGLGNVAGIALAGLAMTLRFSTRHGDPRVRYPEVATRVLFYAALPLAVGVPLGWLALTVPAAATSAICTVRADRRVAGAVAAPHRWVPNVW